MRVELKALAGLISLGLATVAVAERSAVCAHGDGDVQPIHVVNPPFPRPAALFCIEGHATYEFTIGKDGIPREISTVSSVPEGVFDAAGQIIGSWRFEPRCEDGAPIERKATQTIEFNLPWTDSEHCPENLPDDLLEALVAITTLKIEVTQLTSSAAAALEPLPIESTLPPPYGEIERAYRRFLGQRLELERGWRKFSWRLVNWLVHPLTMKQDDWHAHAGTRLEAWIAGRLPLRQRWPEVVTSFQQELRALQEIVDLPAVGRTILIDNQIRSLDGEFGAHQEVVRVESEVYDAYRGLIDWLGERTQDWAIEAGELRFASAALEAEHERRRAEIRRLHEDWDKRLSLPYRISWSGAYQVP